MSKYKAVKETVDGILFDSKKEARRWSELKLLSRAGEIYSLARQIPFEIAINGKKVFVYKADFSYRDKNNALIIEDVKGFKTPVYRLKKRCVEAAYNLQIREI